MSNEHEAVRGRRAFITNGLILAGALAVPNSVGMARRLKSSDLKPVSPAPVPPPQAASVPATPIKLTSPKVVRPELFREAMAALDRHGSRIAYHDRIAIADFTAPSKQARFHFVDLRTGASSSLLVAHGSGSDPAHTGWLKRFSNDPGSNATSEGAFLTDDYYTGKHGRSQRLIGLDRTNDNALERAIVIHSAWYAEPDMIASRGMLGRSQGCFAVGSGDLDRVFQQLGPGRMIYSGKA